MKGGAPIGGLRVINNRESGNRQMNQIMIRLSQRPNLIQDNLNLVGIHSQQLQQQDINQSNLNI